jgi:predicted nicotinamide N-methyase
MSDEEKLSFQDGESIFKGKNVLELGSGPGLCGFSAAKLGAKKVILTDYKEQIMELIAYNISHYYF